MTLPRRIKQPKTKQNDRIRCRKEPWHKARFTEDSSKVAVKCLECYRQMWLPPSKVSNNRRCSAACNAVYRAKVKAARTRPCETCGKPFCPRPNQLRAGHGKFCSQKCNLPGVAAANSPAGYAQRLVVIRKKRAAGEWRVCKGAAKPNWKGGEARTAERIAEYISSGKSAAWTREWRKKNAHKVREYKTRRAGKKFGKLPRGTVARIAELQKHKCAICQVSVKTKFHVDHIMPLKLGGKHEAGNIQILCPTCNVRKQAFHPIDYMQSLGRLL